MATYQLDAAFKLLEHDIYGSSCMCLDKTCYNYSIKPPVASNVYNRTLGKRQYEAGNHLGNVISVFMDKKIPRDLNADNIKDFYVTEQIASTDYYAFGQAMPGRTNNSGNYRYGFNGKENDNEVKGQGNQVDFGARIYDSRLGKWLSLDPLRSKFAGWSPYNFCYNSPISVVDPDGLEGIVVSGAPGNPDAGGHKK
jgi:RHS repeat-associated protein